MERQQSEAYERNVLLSREEEDEKAVQKERDTMISLATLYACTN